ncbi:MULTISPECIES: AAA family ATPase [Vibrio]|uniref:AAA family ATPase n=1 Tax=Vibrio TaxID=662 RepID=UPI0002E3D5D1|nr:MULTISPECIES: AAA family ATPase [Vibrio]OEF86137.1 hypothetical protein A162_09515 [Vibrio tasmaniensis 1F-155]
MKIQKIKIENFKCFSELEVELNQEFNVLIGDNATGKTSFLDAVSYSLGTYFIGVKKVSGDSNIELRSLKHCEKRTTVTDTHINYKLPFKVTLDHTIGKNVFSWFRDTDKTDGGSTSYKDANKLIDFSKDLCKNIFDENDTTTLPLIAYYGTERLFNERAQRIRKASTRLDGYVAALDPRSFSERFVNWFADYEDSILKLGRDPELYNAFCEAIITMVPDWEKITYSHQHKTLMAKSHDSKWETFNMLSSGYRNIIRLAGDIAYRAIKLNPHLKSKAVVATEGVVLIDELDMHLHPDWQKTIVSSLKKAFPSIQFIVTSHSAFIIQSVKGSEVIKLSNFGIETVSDNTHLKGLEDIIEDEMEVKNARRSEQYQEYMKLAEEYFSLLEEGSDTDISTLRKRLDDIEYQFNDDPALVALLQAERKSS